MAEAMPPEIALLSMPYHDGRPGFGMGRGPARILGHGQLMDELARLGCQAHVDEIMPVDDSEPEIARVIELDRRLARRVRTAVDGGAFPLVLAGNCNSCLGTVSGVQPMELGVIWFDAHADFDSPDDNLSGFFDVMGLSILTGTGFQALAGTIPGFQAIDERRVVVVGVRDLDPYQELRLRSSRINALYGEQLRQDGVGEVLQPALGELRSHVSAVYLHIDLDSLDPSEGSANEYAAPGGLSVAELERSLDLIFDRFTVAAAAVTAYNPEHDDGGRMLRTARRVVSAIADRVAAPS